MFCEILFRKKFHLSTIYVITDVRCWFLDTQAHTSAFPGAAHIFLYPSNIGPQSNAVKLEVFGVFAALYTATVQGSPAVRHLRLGGAKSSFVVGNWIA